MDITSITNFYLPNNNVCVSGSVIDEEYKRIVERMLALGLTPSGNKSSDKTKLREVELQMLKSELGVKGTGTVSKNKYLTISPQEILQLQEKLKEKSEQKDLINENKTLMLGAEQQAILNKYYFRFKGKRN